MPSAKNWRGMGLRQNKMTVSAARPKILIIEDQPEVLAMMSLLLKRAGLEVATAKTGMEGIRLSQNEEFDLVTVDVDLSDMDGFRVCRHLKQDFCFCRTPVIFVSGRFSEGDRRRGFEAGAADFIFKPFDAFIFTSRILSHVKTVKARILETPQRFQNI
jgi:DNA-binding response OmpR family regulator